ncbi:MAG: glutathione synthetase [Gammaproteobacteria bacterium SG8_31]|jgi:glutathione synthase|nr:MAG: glutathione synthetase [Gammaproteobacteria bacterium SG8_31]
MNQQKRRLGVVMDPISSIKPVKDSTLAMLLEAQARDWDVRYMEQSDLWVRDGHLRARTRGLTVRDNVTDWFDLGEATPEPLADLDVILMRKDPPFDMEYIYTTYLLERAEDAGCLVVNRSGSLRDVSEKAYTMWFADCCPPTLITRSMEEIRRFLTELGSIVVKPLDGMGGRSIFVIHAGDPNSNVIIETITEAGTRFAMAQQYIREIADGGDKRILLIDGQPYPHALARIPAAGDNRGNLAAGARAEGRELTEKDRWICERVGPVLREKGIIFAGLDVIGDYLTEINVTSPTGIRELQGFFGDNIAGLLFDAIEARL